MNSNHICVISDDYPSKDRMVFVFVQQLVEALVDEGAKISVVAPQSLTRSFFRGVELLPMRQTYRTHKDNEYEVFRPYSLSFSNGNKWLYKFVKKFNSNRINRCLNRISPQIVYGHFWHNAMRGFVYAEKYNKPLFVACGEGDDALDDWAIALSDSAKKRVRSLVNGVISVSTENMRKCLAYGLSTSDNTIVLPNCVNEDVFHPINGDDLRRKLGASKSDFVVSFTGSFIERKGYNRLSDAIDKLRCDDLKVIFLGRPMDGYEGNVPKCRGIIHCGSVNHDELPKYLCASDVFVLPTLKEGCCNAIVEALACGLPVISSNRPFNDDILNENNSVLVNPESVDEIASAIKLLMEDKEKYHTLKQYTNNHAREHSIKERARGILNFIDLQIQK